MKIILTEDELRYVNEIKSIVDSMMSDMEKFYCRGEDLPGKRLKKSLKEIKKVSDAMKKDITDKLSKRKINRKLS